MAGCDGVFTFAQQAAQTPGTPDCNVLFTPPCCPLADAGPDQTICLGASATIGGSPTASQGSSTYTYLWGSSPAGFTSTASNPGVTPALTTEYYVSVNDGFCIQIDTVLISVQSVTVSPTTTPETCSGLCDGSAVATASGTSTAFTSRGFSKV